MPVADLSFDFANLIIDNASGTDPLTINQLFSYAIEQFHITANIHNDFCFDSLTPSALVAINGWYLTKRCIQLLKGGSVTTTYGTDEIEQITGQSGGYTNAITSDIGKVVVGTGFDASDAILIDFDNTLRIWWVRTLGTTTSVSSSVSVTITGGTGAMTTTGSSIDGDDTYANIQSITVLALDTPNAQVIYSIGGVAVTPANFAGAPDITQTNADRGFVDTLIPIKDMGVVRGLPAGTVQVLVRDQISTYHDFSIDISGGGTTAIPTTNGEESKDTLPSHYIVVESVASGTPAIDDLLTATSGTLWQAKIVTVYAATGAFRVLGITTPSAAIADDDTFGDGTWTAVVRGTPGGQFYTVDTTDIIEGDYGVELLFGTSTNKADLRGHLLLAEGTGGTQGAVVCESNHDVNADADFYLDVINNDAITGTGISATETDGVELNRRALDDDDIRIKSAAWDLTIPTTIGDAAIGDDITQATSNATGTIIEINALVLTVSSNNGTAFDNSNTVTDTNGGTLSQIPSTATRVKTFDAAYTSASTFTYTVRVDGAGKTVARVFHYLKHFQARGSNGGSVAGVDNKRELYLQRENSGLENDLTEGQFYFRAFTDIDTPANNFATQDVKSPLALQIGSSLNAGQGIFLNNFDAADANNIVSSDNSAATHIPLTSKSVTLTGLPVGAAVEIVLDDGSGQEDEDQFGISVATAGASTITFDSSLPNDVPTGGADNEIIIKAVDINSSSPDLSILRYRGASRSGAVVTLDTGDTGTAEGGSGAQLLNDTAAFGNTVVGDVIRNTTTGEFAIVTGKPDANSVTTTVTSGGSGWTTSDTWESNLVAFTMDGSDTAWIPFMDRVASTATEVVTVLDDGAINIIIRIRDTTQKDFDTTITAWVANASIANSIIPIPQYTPTSGHLKFRPKSVPLR